MKKSVGFYIALNRNLIIVLAVMLGITASGLIAWQVSATGGSEQKTKMSASELKEKRALEANPSANAPKTQSGVTRAQDNPRGMYRGVQTAVHFDVSQPLRDMKGSPVGELSKFREFEERSTGNEGALGPQDIDKTVQMLVGDGVNVMPTPIVSFDSTIGCGGCQPPDPNGDVGPNHYVAMGNLQFQIFNKTGTSLLGPTNTNALWAGFGGACQSENAGDPVVLYDQLDDRWILTQFTANGPQFFNCVAVSTSPDPTGTYFRYAFTTGTNFPDYPKYGMWNDALYISTREFAGASFAGVGAYAVNRAQLIAGNPAAQLISFLATPGGSGGAFNVGDGLVPTDLDGAQLPPAGSPNFFLGSTDQGGPYGAPSDALTVWKFTANFVTPASSTFVLANTVPIAAFDTVPAFCSGRSCVPQPGTTARIDHLGYRQRPLFRAAYRNFGSHESIVTNQSVEASATMSGIRWWEMRSPNSSPVIHQEGTYAPGISDGIHRWMGAIAMDTVGNMALGFSASSATTTFPGSWYTGRLASDPLGTMPQGEAVIVNGAASQTSGQRWGDYTDMVVDPVDDCTFWYTNEYIPAGGQWRMRVGSFKFPNCSLGPNFSLAVTPVSQEISAPATATYTVNTTSISGFTTPIVLTASGNPPGTTVNFSPNPVTPGGSSTMTVGNTQLAAPGAYTINVLGTAGAITQNQNVALTVYTAAPSTPTLTAPANGATGTALAPTFTWTASTQAKTYTLEVATDAGFTNIVHTGTGITGTTYSGATLSSDTQYFWRVRALNPCGTSLNSAAFSFRTGLICTSTVSYTGPPVAIPENLPAGVNINIPVTGVGAVTDLNFQFDTAGACDATLGNANAAVDHTFIGDLSFKLTPPDGSPTVTFQARRGGTRENICLSLLDDEGGFPNISTLSSVTGSPQAGNFSPETTGMFSLLDGESADGTWVLNVSDNAGIDTGSVRRFSMIFNTGGTSCGGTPSPTPTASPSNSPTSTSTSTPTTTATPTASPSPSCGTVSYTGPAVAIPENLPAGVNVNLPVSGVGTVTDLNFRFDTAGACDATLGNANAAVDHTFIGDLTFRLTPPDGSPTVAFQARRGGTRENICASLLDDEGGFPNISTLTSVTGSPQSGNFSPETTGMLSLLDGENANGTWVLNVSDNAGIDTGSLRRFSLEFGGPCGSPTATSTGTPATATATNTPTSTSTATATPTASPSPGSCTFSNGGLNPQALTESGVAAPAGFFWSEVQHNTGNNAVSNTVAGFGAIQGANRLADNFTLSSACTINTVAFYGYLTGGGATSPFTAYTLQIWNGRPGDPGSVVVFGDTTTNRLASSVDTTYFRIFNTAVPPPGTVQGTTRKIWRNTLNVNTVLQPGTYWFDWASTVTGAANHFHPSKTIQGSRGAAGDNARQFTVAGATWADAVDTGNPVTPPSVPQDFPFDVVGSSGGTPVPTFTATVTNTATPTPTGSPSCNAVTASYTGPAVAIPDNIPAGVSINLPVSGVGSVSDLNFQFDTAGACDATLGNANAAMDHTFIGDLTFRLTPPDGSPTVAFQARRGGTRENICLSLLNDEGGFPNISTLTSVTGSPQTGNFTPETTGALSLLDGENANGTWVLNVSDNAGIDTGFMRRFSLIFNSEGGCASPSATATATPTSGGTPPATSVQFSSATFNEDESQTAAITVTRTGDTTGTTTVNFATSNGTATGGASCISGVDYISVAQAVTFAPTVTSQTVNVQLCSDTLTEPTQTVNMTLTGAGVGSPSTAVLSIIDTASAFRSTGSICTTFGGTAAPYPATIAVSNGPASIGSIRVTLFDVTSTVPDSMDFLLVGPGGQKFILLADAGGVVDLINPVTLTFSDAAGQVVPNGGPLTTGVFEPTSWEPGQATFLAPAPPAPYNEPGSTVGGVGTQTLIGNFGTTNSNGTWSLYMRDDAGALTNAITACVNGGWGLEFLGATAANASISGRVATSDGRGIRNANAVIMGNSLATPIVVTTGSFGYFSVDGLVTGETYVVTVNSQRYTFGTPSRVISLIDNVIDADFIADPQE